MRLKNLDLNLLVALDALLTERNVTRAGEKIFRSQSAMSNTLSRLRLYFDDELLVPLAGKLELTPRAELLQQAVHDVLLRIETTVAAVPEFKPTTTGNPPDKPKAREVEFSKKEVLHEEVEVYG